jgi:hypothetical protein
MCQKYVTDAGHLVKRQVAQPGAGIDQYIVVDQKGSGSQVCTDTTGPSEYLYLHALVLDFV